MGAIASQITSLTIVYSSVYSSADQRKHIKGPRHWSLCKWPVRRKIFPFDDVIMARLMMNDDGRSSTQGTSIKENVKHLHFTFSKKKTSLDPGRRGNNFKIVIFMLLVKVICPSSEIALRWTWMPQNTFDDKSTLVQVPSGNKRGVCRHIVSLGYNVLIKFNKTTRWYRQQTERR